MKMNWLVDTTILESRSVVGDLLGAIQENPKCNLFTTKYIPLSDEQDYGSFTHKDPVVLYGTIGYVTKCKTAFYPGNYGVHNNTNVLTYMTNIDNELFLNSDYIMVPFYKLKKYHKWLFDLFNTDDLFIRPNSGRKTFTGYTITRQNADFELSSSMQLTSVTDETICLVATAKRINAEYRFVVGAGDVIDGSEYRWDNKLDIRHDFSGEAFDLARKVAQLEWQVDRVYTVDVADTDDGPRIVELNGFSCAGLYACDKKLVVDKVTDIAIEDYNGIL